MHGCAGGDLHLRGRAAGGEQREIHRGAVSQVVKDEASNTGMQALTGVQDGAALYNVALFIDQNSATIHPQAAAEDWFRPWGWGGGGW